MFLDVLIQVVILMVLIGIGVIFTYAGALTEEGVKSITNIVVTIVTPCVIIKSFMREFSAKQLKGLLLSFLITACVHILFIVLSRAMLHSKDKSRERIMLAAAVFSNCGFMSIPLQQSILGDMGVFYGSSYIAIFNLFLWSYGIMTVSGDKKFLTPKKLVINPGMIGLVLGLAVFLFSVKLPSVISEPISYIAALNTPLPMIIIGYHLTKSNVIKALFNPACMLTVASRLIILPSVALGLLYLCGVRGVMLVSSVISCSAPSAAMTTMFASKYGGDTDFSVDVVSLSTVFSLITMPILITIAKYLA